MSMAEKVQSVPDGSSYHFYSSQTCKSLKFWLARKKGLSWVEAGILVAASQEVQKSWGMSAASQRGDGYKPTEKCVSRVVFFVCGWDRCVPAVSGLSIPIQAPPRCCYPQVLSLPALLGSCPVLGDSSRDRAGELLGTNTAPWHSAVCLAELCHQWKGLGTLLLGDKQLLATQ